MKFTIYLLTREGENDRMVKAINRTIANFGGSVNVVLGIHAHAKPWENVSARLSMDVSPACGMSIGEQACADGHRRMLMEFLETEEKYCLCVEDDALFLKSGDEFGLILQSVDESFLRWDWIHMGGYQYRADAIPHPKIKEGGWRASDGSVAQADECGWCATATFFSRRGAQKILDRTKEIEAPFDCYTRYPRSGDLVFNTLEDYYLQDITLGSHLNNIAP